MLKKGRWWLLGAILAVIPFIMAFEEEDDINEQAAFEVRTYITNGITSFETSVTRIKESIASGDTTKAREQFLNARIAFKHVEFYLDGTDSDRIRFINGPPLPYVEFTGDGKTALKPHGLQVLEEYLFDEVDFPLAVKECDELLYEMMLAKIVIANNPISNALVFQSLRYNIIRIETLSLPGFDCPITLNIAPEIIANLVAMDTVLKIYSNIYTGKQVREKTVTTQSTLRSAQKYLQKNGDFETIDRLHFIKTYLQPLSAQIIAVFESIQSNKPVLVRIFKYPRAVNLNIPIIYDKDFLNPLAYAERGYYGINTDEQASDELVALGRKLFFDSRLSADNKMSCGTCHQPEMAFTDGRKRSITNREGEVQMRNTPTLLYANLQDRYFYDFKAKSLEVQVGHVVRNPQEFNTSYKEIVGKLNADSLYKKMFASLFPSEAPHAISEWSINKALASFVRSLGSFDSPFDRYMTGRQKDIAPEVKRGFNLFMGKAKCGTCHFAPTFFGVVPPMFKESESEVLGTLQEWNPQEPVLTSDSGRYHFQSNPIYIRSHKTSTVRNIALTAPYMHNGGFADLESVMAFYNKGGGAGLGLDVPHQTLSPDPLNLTEAEVSDVIAFMKSLTDTDLMKKP